MKKAFIILACAFTCSAILPVCAESGSTFAVAVKQSNEPITKDVLVGEWRVEEGEGMRGILSFNSNGKLNITASETSNEEGMSITVKIDIKNVDWSVEHGKLILKFDSATVDLDIDLPAMLAAYKDQVVKEFENQKNTILEEAKKTMANKSIIVNKLDNDTLLVELDEDGEHTKLVRIKNDK